MSGHRHTVTGQAGHGLSVPWRVPSPVHLLLWQPEPCWPWAGASLLGNLPRCPGWGRGQELPVPGMPGLQLAPGVAPGADRVPGPGASPPVVLGCK